MRKADPPLARRPSDGSFAKLTHATVADLDRATRRLQAGKDDLDAWADRFHAVMVERHTEAWALGRQRAGDLAARTEDDARFGLDAADGQGDFLTKFLGQLKAGDPRYFDEEGRLIEGSLDSRVHQYATRLRGTGNQAFVEAGEDDDEFDWILGAENHCGDCPELASLSPYTAATVISHPGDGGTDCKVNCACKWLRRRGQIAGFSRVDVFGSDDPN